MNSKRAGLVLVTLAVFCTSQARADTADVNLDVRCVIVAMRMGEAPGVAAQTAAMMSALYYLGRLDAVSPKPDIEALIESELVKMTPEEFKTEAARCGSQLTERGKQLQVMGQHLVQRGKELQLEEQQKKP